MQILVRVRVVREVDNLLTVCIYNNVHGVWSTRRGLTLLVM